jgi:CubicO group peptidase (beta-lactamase class C family)
MSSRSARRVRLAIVCAVVGGAIGCSDFEQFPVLGTARNAVVVSFQAENGTWSSGAVESEHVGYTGTGYVNTANASNTWVQWTVSAQAAGPAAISIRFANASGTRPGRIELNGAVAISSISFPATGAWTTWSTLNTTLNLVQGNNAIRVVCTGSSGCPNIDRLDVDLPSGGTGGTGGAGGAGGAGGKGGSSGSGGTAGSGGLGGNIQQDNNEFYERPASSAFILLPGQLSSATWKYRFTAPAADWKEPGFNDSTWSNGAPGFYSGAPLHHDLNRTAWAARTPAGTFPDLYARTTFRVDNVEAVNEAMFWGRWDDILEVYINGVPAVLEPMSTGGYRFTGLSPDARNAIQLPSNENPLGTNTLAVKVRDTGGEAYFDLGIVRNPNLRKMPMAGSELNSRLAEYTFAMQRFMQQHGLTAGALAVMKDTRIVVNRAFGWKDRLLTTPLPANTLMRIASVQKSSTVAAMRKIIAEGFRDPVSNQVITGQTLVFPYLAQYYGLTPPPGVTVDPRVNQVTIQHLMDHRGGLRGVDFSPYYYQRLQISVGQERPIDNVRFTYGEPLLFTPGSIEEYSNIGYGVLQFLISTFKGDLATYMRNQLYAQVATAEFFPAYERLNLRSPREPFYATFEQGAYRWLYLENESNCVATAEALVRAARAYTLFPGEPLLNSSGQYIGTSGTWVRGGGGVGVSSIQYQDMGRQLSFATIFNIDIDQGSLARELESVMFNMPDAAYQ